MHTKSSQKRKSRSSHSPYYHSPFPSRKDTDLLCSSPAATALTATSLKAKQQSMRTGARGAGECDPTSARWMVLANTSQHAHHVGVGLDPDPSPKRESIFPYNHSPFPSRKETDLPCFPLLLLLLLQGRPTVISRPLASCLAGPAREPVPSVSSVCPPAKRTQAGRVRKLRDASVREQSAKWR